MTQKWSESSNEGVLLARITKALKKKLSAEYLDDEKDIDKLLDYGRKLAYISMQKSNLAKNTDWEERLAALEHAKKTTEDKQAEMDLKVRHDNK